MLDEYSKDASKRDGRCSTCKPCATKRTKAHMSGRLDLEARTCPRCGQSKRIEDFAGGGKKTYCKPCWREYQREYSAANPERRRGYKRENYRRRVERDPSYGRAMVLRRYGLTLETAADMLERQGDGCAVCGSPEPGGKHGTWHVDHDHGCCPPMQGCADCVRGLLCGNCNLLLGHAHDDADRLRAAANYLDAWRAREEAHAHG